MPQAADIKTWAIQPEDSPAHMARVVASAIFETGGVIGVDADSFLVTEDTGANMQISVGSGAVGDLAAIEGAAAGQGIYIIEHQAAAELVPIAASDPTNDRIDRVIARVYDDEADSSGNDYGDIEVLQGTPAGSPSAPALPNGAISLATILVQNGVTAITDADITDLRAVPTLREGLVPDTGRFLGYAQVTSGQSGITSVTDLTSLSVAVNVEAGRRLRITGHGQLGVTASAATSAVGTVREGSTELGRFGSVINETANAISQMTEGSVVVTPSAGAHTYKLSLERGAGSGTASLVASATNPAFILVMDIGPV